MDMLGAIVWGFVLGFVGWPTAFGAIGPGTNWLLGRPATTLADMVVGLIVALTAIWGMLVAVALLPAILVVAKVSAGGELPVWRELVGRAFVASIAGHLALGFLVKFGGAKKRMS